MFLSLCSWIERSIEIKRKKVQSSPVSFAHRAFNLLLKEFYVQAHILKILIKTKKTKPLVIPVGNHWQHGAQGISPITGSTFSAAHRQKNTVAGHKCRFIQQDNLISLALARAWAQVEQRELAQAASGVPGVSLRRSLWSQPCPASRWDWQWHYRRPELGNLSLAPAGKGEAHWTVFKDLDTSV